LSQSTATNSNSRQLSPLEYELLLTFGIGLTDVVKGQSGSDQELDFSGVSAEVLRNKVLEYRPRYLCFNGKRAAREFLGRKRVRYGLQPESIATTGLFIAPSTSGAANASWDLSVWQRLADLVLARPAPERR
jgi:TDG/mug DNA glycosylase family protein